MKKLILIFIIVALFACNKTNKKNIVLAPATPSSIPLILAVNNINNLEIELFTNHAQAHAKFLRGDANYIATGFTVGLNFSKQNKKVTCINSWVDDLAFLVSKTKNVNNIKQLKGKDIYLPFKGSPIEKTFDAIAQANNLNPNTDFKKHYLPFSSMLQLLNQGEIQNCIMPEPFVSKSLQNKTNFQGFSLQQEFKNAFNSSFAPQIALFSKNTNIKQISKINSELVKAINFTNNNPKKAIEKTKNYFMLNPELLNSALNRTKFSSKSGKILKNQIENYLKIIKEKHTPNEDFYFIN